MPARKPLRYQKAMTLPFLEQVRVVSPSISNMSASVSHLRKSIKALNIIVTIILPNIVKFTRIKLKSKQRRK